MRQVSLLLPNKTTIEGKFTLWDVDPTNPKFSRITLQFLGRELTSTGVNYNSALIDIRSKLESEGILVRCYGGSRNVFPSSVTSGMARGGMAYKVYLGKTCDPGDRVVIFDAGPDVDPCTLEEQEQFRKEWLLSIGVSPNKKYIPWKTLFRQKPLTTFVHFLREKLRKQ